MEETNYFFEKQENSKNLAVLFPGVNYSCDAPLLHYAARLAKENCSDVIKIKYSRKIVQEPFLIEELQDIINESAESINSCIKRNYDNIYFISKSIGTVIAGQVQENLGYHKVKNLFLTPIKLSVPYINKNQCLVITGDKDKRFLEEERRMVEKFVELYIIKDGNHSLEVPGDYKRSIDILKETMELCNKYMRR